MWSLYTLIAQADCNGGKNFGHNLLSVVHQRVGWSSVQDDSTIDEFGGTSFICYCSNHYGRR